MATPPHLRPFVLSTEPVEPASAGSVDLYLPAARTPSPVVVLVHGMASADQPSMQRWPLCRGYAGELARRGVVAAVPALPLHGFDTIAESAVSLRRAVAVIRADPRIDGDRVALWFFSNGGTLLGEWLDDRPRWLQAVAATYPRLRVHPAEGAAPTAAADVIGAVADLPLLLTRVEHERAETAATVAEFVTAAADTAVEVLDVPGAAHGFDMEPATPAATAAVETALSWVVDRLVMERAVPHQRLAAYAVLRRDDEILLTRISARGHHAGAWTLPGGGVEHGEQVRAALVREMREETGLEVEVGALRDVHSVHFTGRAPSGRLEDFHGVHLIFDAEVAAGQPDPQVVETDGSTDAVAWIGIGGVESGRVPVLDVVRHAVR